jgi:hypothetical protein
MKITVIKVTQNGTVGYLRSASIFGGLGSSSGPITDNPLNAINYADPEHSKQLDKDLDVLKIAGDEWFAMSGVPVDSAHVVDLEITIQEVACREGRSLHKNQN